MIVIFVLVMSECQLCKATVLQGAQPVRYQDPSRSFKKETKARDSDFAQSHTVTDSVS